MVQQMVGPECVSGGTSALVTCLGKPQLGGTAFWKGLRRRRVRAQKKKSTSRSAIYPDREKHPQYLILFAWRKDPLLLFIDNLQWADPSTLSLLLSFIKSTSSGKYPIYLVAAFRHFEAHQTGSPDSPFRLFHRESLKEPTCAPLRLR